MSDGHTDGYPPAKPPKFCLNCLGTGEIYWPAIGSSERTRTCRICQGSGLYTRLFNLTDEEIEVYADEKHSDGE